MIYAPRGPVGDVYDIEKVKELIKDVDEVARKYNAFLFRFDPEKEYNEKLDYYSKNIFLDSNFESVEEKKLNEEYMEVLSSSGKDRIEELADMLEIIKALAALEGSNLDEVVEVADAKALKRGSFNKRIFLEKTTD